jgi:glycosyltransferase involved in cell wall biosynthesis
VKNIAILHPWFLMKGGGEKVVDVLGEMYPEADIFTLFCRDEFIPTSFRSRVVHASPLNEFPRATSGFHRHLMPLYPWAVENFDLRGYDLIISSCGPAMMGANVDQDATHICYCHTPQRSWWDLLAEHKALLKPAPRFLFALAASRLRTWEFSAMQRVDTVVANSNYIAQRVHKYFRRESKVIYPPVAVSNRAPAPLNGEYYLTLGRLEKQKRVDLLIHACNRLGRKLLIAGTGKEAAHLKSIAGPRIEFLGFVRDKELDGLFQNARAFLFAADEDFGIAPVEAQGYGRPVVAYGHGGSLETVRAGQKFGSFNSGVYFHEQTVDSVVDGIRRFETQEDSFVPTLIQQHASQFDTSVFIKKFRALVESAFLPGEERYSSNEGCNSPLLVSD